MWLNHLLSHILSFLLGLPQDSVFSEDRIGPASHSDMSSLGVHCEQSVDWLLLELPGSAQRHQHKLLWSSACCKSKGHSSQATGRQRTRRWTADSLILLLSCFCLWTLVSELTASFEGVPSFTDPHYCPWPEWLLNSATLDGKLSGEFAATLRPLSDIVFRELERHGTHTSCRPSCPPLWGSS